MKHKSATDEIDEIRAKVRACRRPQPGWKCTRGEHADGPCAAVPDLPPLDVHGVDDDGLYRAPSRARYTEMLATEDALAARVTELQAHNTKLEDERRKYKALHAVARKLLGELLVDVPLANRLSNADPMMERAIAHDLPMFAEVLARNELLEADAWCGAAVLARQFVAEADTPKMRARFEYATSVGCHDLGAFISGWSARFGDALKR